MKSLILLTFMSSVLNAQTVKEQILDNIWYLTEINIDGESYIPPENEEIGIITMGIEPENETMYWFHTEVCSSDMSGFITWNSDNQFSFWDFAGGFQCSSPENQDFEYMYASFFGIGGANGAPMECSIIENPNSSLILHIQNQFGNTVTYTNQLMSVYEFGIKNITVHPNPVKDKLTLENPDLKINKIRVVDANGNSVFQQKVNSIKTEIDFSHLPKGVYFVQFESNGKVLKTEKVIKK